MARSQTNEMNHPFQVNDKCLKIHEGIAFCYPFPTKVEKPSGWVYFQIPFPITVNLFP